MDDESQGNPRARRTNFVVTLLSLVVAAPAVGLAATLRRTWFEDHLTQSFCALDSHQLNRLAAVRVALVAFALLAVFVVRPRLARWIAANTGKKVLFSTLRISAAVVLALLVASFVLRARHAHDPVLVPPSLPPIHFEPEFWWVGDANANVTLRADDREIPYSQNADGYRMASPDFRLDPDAPTILFAGESITEGVGVMWDEAYPAVVAADLHVQPDEVAVHGYGHDQIYWATLKELPKLHHPVAVVTFMIPQMLERDLDTTRPRLALDADGQFIKLPPDPPMAEWWKSSPLRKTARGLFPYHDDSPIALARAIFAATQKEAAARGAFALFVTTNWGPLCLPPDPGKPTLDERLFGDLEVHWIDVRLDPLEVEHSTHHPNAKAHRKLADAIEKALIDAKVATK